jgi:hypothetical protein
MRLEFEGAATGTWDLISTCIHESDVLWVVPRDAPVCPAESFLTSLFALVPACRLALIQTSGDRDWLEGCAGASPAGALPGAGDQSYRIYTARRTLQRKHPAVRCQVLLDTHTHPGVTTQFHILERDGQAIGITGLYVAEWWPHIAWGGWGGMKRRFAGLHAATDAFTLTERLASQQSCEWFCVETSGAREYRPARRLYERHGMRIFLTVDDFFRGAGQSEEERRYVVYGKRAAVR